MQRSCPPRSAAVTADPRARGRRDTPACRRGRAPEGACRGERDLGRRRAIMRACSSSSRSSSTGSSRRSPGPCSCSSPRRCCAGAPAAPAPSRPRRLASFSSSRSRPSRTGSSGSWSRAREPPSGRTSSTTPSSCSAAWWTAPRHARAARSSSTATSIGSARLGAPARGAGARDPPLLRGSVSQPGDVAESDRLAAKLVEWGVPPSHIVVEASSRNTRENAIESSRIAAARGWRTVLVVTSAYHAPRALGCFRAVGLEPDFLPVDHRAGDGAAWAGCRARKRSRRAPTRCASSPAGSCTGSRVTRARSPSPRPLMIATCSSRRSRTSGRAGEAQVASP